MNIFRWKGIQNPEQGEISDVANSTRVSIEKK